jgi:putative RNA 2'-phosphotransferase
MLTKQKLVKKSRIVAEILRHDPYKHGLTITPNGWVSVLDILKKVNIISSFQELTIIVSKCNRYSFNEDFLMIRANQGHSLPDIDLELERVFPTKPLFHGTTPDIKDLLLNEGLKPMKRQYVHLSKDIETAYSVGKRYSRDKKPLIFQIEDFNDMEIYISLNGIYLTKSVKPDLLHIIKY